MASVPTNKIPDLSSAITDSTNSISEPASKADLSQIKCLFFDVFGTCVDWRKSITDVMYEAAQASLNSAAMSLATRIRLRASAMTYEDWGKLAQEWRNSYLTFTRALANDPNMPYKTVDQHHLDSLREILLKHGLVLPRPEGDTTPADQIHDGSLWDEANIVNLSLKWHHLSPWADSSQGIRELNKKFKTCTLSNGNMALLEDLVRNADMPFTMIYSAEMFKSYKPSPKVYLGAAQTAGLKPEECMMVAAHLDDLKYAKSNGFSTLYVERPLEERHLELRQEKGLVDVWVKEGEDGFIAAAEKLGIAVERKPVVEPVPTVPTKEEMEPVKS